MRVGFARVASTCVAGRDRDLDDRRDLGFLASVDAVIDQLFDDDARPLVGLVPGLSDQLLLGAEFHQARGGERHPLDLVRRLIRLLRTPGHDAARLQAEPRPRDVDGADLAAQGRGNDGGLVAAVPHLPQQLLALRRPADARLNIGKLCKNFRFGLRFQLAESLAGWVIG